MLFRFDSIVICERTNEAIGRVRFECKTTSSSRFWYLYLIDWSVKYLNVLFDRQAENWFRDWGNFELLLWLFHLFFTCRSLSLSLPSHCSLLDSANFVTFPFSRLLYCEFHFHCCADLMHKSEISKIEECDDDKNVWSSVALSEMYNNDTDYYYCHIVTL